MPVKMQLNIDRNGIDQVRFLADNPGDPRVLDEAFALFRTVREGLAIIDKLTSQQNIVVDNEVDTRQY